MCDQRLVMVKSEVMVKDYNESGIGSKWYYFMVGKWHHLIFGKLMIINDNISVSISIYKMIPELILYEIILKRCYHQTRTV